MPEYVYIGLGSNLNNPRQHIDDALSELRMLAVGGDVLASPMYLTAPVGPQNQPDYYNAVAGFESELGPIELLSELQAIEHDHQRQRLGEQWQARTLDLDLLFYADRVIDMPELKVPHPRIKERAFVLKPLSDLAKDLEIPGQGQVKQLLELCDQSGIRKQVSNVE
jgi:2-amino-4-hydroxy-6-hydroxymethyldihydropteridine diphosphokinase